MKLFVTGATGFLGRAFCRVAAEAGIEILALCRPGARSEGLPQNCRTASGTLSSVPWRAIEEFRPDAALHLAWIASPGSYLHAPENTAMAVDSAAMFRGLIDRGVGHLIGTGTCIEYAPRTEMLHEDRSPLGPKFPYAVAKVETCKQLQRAAEGAGVCWTWFRPFYPYGEGEHPDRMPSMIVRRLGLGQSVELKTPDSIKDYIHVSDVASAMVAALEHPLTGAVNIATGTGIQILELAKMVAKHCGCKPERVSRAVSLHHDEFPITVADISKLRETGWSPRITLEQGLARLFGSLLEPFSEHEL